MNELIKPLKDLQTILEYQVICSKNELSLGEACIFLDLTPFSLLQLARRGQLCCYTNNNNKIFFKRTELETWVLGCSFLLLNDDCFDHSKTPEHEIAKK